MNKDNSQKFTDQYKNIVKTASRLMSQKGYKGASLQEIADAVGIHKSTFFHYFRNKEALLLAVLKMSLGEVSENLNRIQQNENLNPEEKLKQAISNHLKLLVKYKYNVNVYLNEIRFLSNKNKKKYLDTRKSYATCFKKIIDEIQQSNPIKFKGLDSKIVTFGILGMCNWVVKWYKGSEKYKIEDISDMFYRLITTRWI